MTRPLDFKFYLQFKIDTVCFHLPSTSYELLIEQAPRIAAHGPPTDGSSFTSLWKRAWTFFFLNVWQLPKQLFLSDCRLDASVPHIVAAQMPYVFLPLDPVVI